jgi:hypothetical protein
MSLEIVMLYITQDDFGTRKPLNSYNKTDLNDLKRSGRSGSILDIETRSMDNSLQAQLVY